MRYVLTALLFVALSVNGSSAGGQETETSGQPLPWNACCGVGQWPMDHGMRGHGMMGSMPRHHKAMMAGVPAPYSSFHNPLPRSQETVDRGANVYAENCASCHGTTGRGDGDAGRNLSPPPGNLAWLSQMRMAQWDPFMYWTVAEGGAEFGSAMPAFKQTLSGNDIWAVIAYIQARLPREEE